MQENYTNSSDYIKSIVVYIDALLEQNEQFFTKIDQISKISVSKDFLIGIKEILTEINQKLTSLKKKLLSLDSKATHKAIEQTGVIEELNKLNYTINTLLSTKIDRLIQSDLNYYPFSDN
jgi:ribosomal protein L29